MNGQDIGLRFHNLPEFGKNVQISGKPDLLLYIPDKKGDIDFSQYFNSKRIIPVEVKAMAPYTFDEINDIDDMLTSSKYYIKKYPAQLLIYLYLENREIGLFYWENKVNFDFKLFEVYAMSYTDYVESLLQKAEKVNKFVAEYQKNDKIEYPERIKDLDICETCQFRHICEPEKPLIKEAEKIDEQHSAELIELIQRREELKDVKKDYEACDKKIKKILKDIGLQKNVILGNYIIEAKLRKRKETIIPASEYWQYNIKKIRDLEVK